MCIRIQICSRVSLLGVLMMILTQTHQITALYSSTSPVKVLTNEQLKSQVIGSKEPYLVEFYASWCGHCKNLVPKYEKAAKALKGIVKVVAVEDQSAMAENGIQGFPTIKAYMDGWKEYNGEPTAESLVNFAATKLAAMAKSRLGGTSSSEKKTTGPSQVTVLTDKNFDDLVSKNEEAVWFVEFYAPWCGHCKKLEPVWDELGKKLKGKVKVGKVDATTEKMLAERFKLEGFPTLKLFPVGAKTTRAAISYDGPRSLESLEEYALKYAKETLKAAELLTHTTFETECNTGLCVLTFLPHIIDTQAQGRKKYLDDLNVAVRAAAGMPVKFFWLQGGDQFDFEEKLHLAFGYPAVVAINIDKQKFATHRGGFNPDAIRTFLSGLVSGQVPVDSLPPSLPKLKTTEAWDGKDYVEPPSEDEDEMREDL